MCRSGPLDLLEKMGFRTERAAKTSPEKRESPQLIHVVNDLKKIAPQLGFSGSAINSGVHWAGVTCRPRTSERECGNSHLVESLRRHGVKEEIIASAVAEVKGSAEAA